MADTWGNTPDNLLAPARKATLVTPSDAADLPQTAKALWIGGSGTVQVVAVDDTGNTGVALGTLGPGTVVPIRVRRVLATGTTASPILALY